MRRSLRVRRRGLATQWVLVVGALLGAAAPVRAETDLWQVIGPYGGNVTALAVVPGSAGVVYAGTDFGGLWKSVSGGASWAPASHGMTDAAITAMAVDPLHRGVVYAGTGSSGVFKSTDAGTTWVPANHGLPGSGTVAALAIDPATSGILWVSISGTGTFESLDGGGSWIARRQDAANIDVTAILLDGGAVYLGTTGAIVGGPAILKGDDTGKTWLPLVIPGVTSAITSLTFDPAAPSTLYAGADTEGVWRSRNGGASWAAAGEIPNPAVMALAADPARSGTVYAATRNAFVDGSPVHGGVFKSSNAGSTWQRASQGMPLTGSEFGLGTATLSLAVDPGHPGVLYAGNAATGVFKSTSHARQWSSELQGLRALAIAQVAVDPERPGTIFAGSTETGLYRSQDGGTTWQQLIADTGVLSITFDPVRSLALYVGTDTGLLRSRNGGDNWAELQAGPQGDFIGPVAIDPSRRATVYAGTFGGVFKSVNMGTTWSPPATTLPCFQPLAIVVDPQAPSDVYVGGTNPDTGCSFQNPNVLLDKSVDGGVHWQQIGNGMGDFNSLVIAPQTSILYAAVHGGVSTSADGGATWQETSLAAISHYIDVVVLDAADPGALYAGDFSDGLFWSPDGAATWSRLADPLTQRNVADVAVTPSSATTVYAATSGGLFRVTRQP